jgi:hypothetical protein
MQEVVMESRIERNTFFGEQGATTMSVAFRMMTSFGVLKIRQIHIYYY